MRVHPSHHPLKNGPNNCLFSIASDFSSPTLTHIQVSCVFRSSAHSHFLRSLRPSLPTHPTTFPSSPTPPPPGFYIDSPDPHLPSDQRLPVLRRVVAELRAARPEATVVLGGLGSPRESCRAVSGAGRAWVFWLCGGVWVWMGGIVNLRDNPLLFWWPIPSCWTFF